MAARVVFIKWLVTFFLEKKYLTAVQNTKNGGEMLPKIIQVCFKVFIFFNFACICARNLANDHNTLTTERRKKCSSPVNKLCTHKFIIFFSLIKEGVFKGIPLVIYQYFLFSQVFNLTASSVLSLDFWNLICKLSNLFVAQTVFQ